MSARALASLALLLAGCGEDPAPAISIADVTPTSLTADDSGNDLTVGVRYHDADGDLGGGGATIIDCRSDRIAAIERVLPAIASDPEPDLPIEGRLDFVVPDVLAIAAGSPPAACHAVQPPTGGAVIFCVRVTDLAGHESNTACTDPVLFTERP